MKLHQNEFNYKVRYWNPSLGYQKIRYQILEAIDKVLSSGNLILGEEVEKFEKSLAEFIGTKYAVGLNSCTDALYLSLKVLGIGKGDEVITVSNTFIATISEIEKVGATPVLVDIGEDYLMDWKKVKEAITERTKAIIPVHLSGDMVDMSEFPKDIPIIEDAAQAMGSERNGYKAGAFGKIGCFSFYPAKLFGAYGDAGALTTNDKELYDKIILLRDHNLIGKREGATEYGVNSRLDEIQAAILNIKFKYINDFLEKRLFFANKYNELLKEIKQVIIPIKRQGRVWQDYIIRVERRNELAEFLDNNGIKVRGHDLFLNHKYDLYDREFIFPVIEKYSKEFLRLPFSAEITEEEIIYVVSKIKEFYEKSSV